MADIGTGYIIELEIESLNGHSMADLDFTAEFFVYSNRRKTYHKGDMVCIQGEDKNRYYALLQSGEVGQGLLLGRVAIMDPLAQWAGGKRPVIITRSTGKVIGGNGVGARYDSAYSNSYTYTIRRIDFLNNTTALELLCLPPNSYATLDDCRFRGNGTDVYNPGGYRIEVNNGTEVALPAGRDAAA